MSNVDDGVFDHRALTVTGRTGLLDGKEALLHANLADATAGRAGAFDGEEALTGPDLAVALTGAAGGRVAAGSEAGATTTTVYSSAPNSSSVATVCATVEAF